MKKIITYITILAAFAAVSCTRTDEAIESLDAPVLTISLNAGEMMTKSAIPNVEDVVTQFDWFFYENNTGTSTPVHHGHYSVSGTTVTYVAGDVASAATADSDEIHLGFNLEDPSYADIKGSYYVYVLANYDGIDHSSVTNLTLEELLAKTMDTNFDEESDDYTKINNFVMDSYSGDDEADFPQLISVKKATDPDKDGKANLPVDLRRVAAKITFTLNISSSLVDANGSTWKPITGSSNFTTYMVNTVNHATVAGEPVDADTNAATGYSQSTGMGAYQTSYATTHVKTATDDDDLVWELDPFYSYPVSYELDSNNAPYLKISLPWENVDSEGNLIGMGATLYYYKVYLRDNDGNAITTLERNKHYIATVNVDKLGGTQEDYVELDTFYYVADWQSPSHMYDGYYAPRFLDAPKEIYIYGDNSISVPVTSSHIISTQITAVSQKNLDGTTKMNRVPSTAHATPDGKLSFTFEYALDTNMPGEEMDITPITWTVHVSHADDSNTNKDIIIYQYPSIYGEQRRTGPNNPNNTTDARYTFLNGTRYHYSTDRSDCVIANNGVNIGSITGGDPTSRDKLILTVTTLASLSGVTAYTDGGDAVKFSDVSIGDPRSKISFPMTYQNRAWSRDDLGEAPNYIDNYLVADPTKSNVIAPRFMFPAGRLGSNRSNNDVNTGGSWRAAAEHCAAYQEGGYPAGRWRLPTEAEVAFCRQLQQYEYIEGLFYDTNPYWTASGTYFQNGAVHTPGNNDRASVRCVYDLWYWGEEPYNNDKQPIALEDVEWVDPATANTPANEWLGFMTE